MWLLFSLFLGDRTKAPIGGLAVPDRYKGEVDWVPLRTMPRQNERRPPEKRGGRYKGQLQRQKAAGLKTRRYIQT